MGEICMSGAKVAGMRVSVGACVTTSMQGYADLGRPAQPIKHIAGRCRQRLGVSLGCCALGPTRDISQAPRWPTNPSSSTVSGRFWGVIFDGRFEAGLTEHPVAERTALLSRPLPAHPGSGGHNGRNVP